MKQTEVQREYFAVTYNVNGAACPSGLYILCCQCWFNVYSWFNIVFSSSNTVEPRSYGVLIQPFFKKNALFGHKNIGRQSNTQSKLTNLSSFK